MSDLKAPIQALHARFADAWKTNDGASAARHFVDEGTLINPFGHRADGRAAIAAMYDEHFRAILRGTSTTFELSSVRAVGGDHAFADGEQTIRGPGGEVVLVVHLATLLRRVGDDWRFVDARPYAFLQPPG